MMKLRRTEEIGVNQVYVGWTGDERCGWGVVHAPLLILLTQKYLLHIAKSLLSNTKYYTEKLIFLIYLFYNDFD